MRRFRWPYLLILPLLAGTFLLLQRGRAAEAFRAGPLGAAQQSAGDVHYTKCGPTGERLEGGLYDPSLAYTPDGSVGWLAYSAITGNRKPIGPYVHTHLARSTDAGATWQFVKKLNVSADGTLERPGQQPLAGAWRYEVSTLVHDPSDPDPAGRWKLFVHRYFWSPEHDRMVTYGWIALRTAADPAGEWSAEEPLFGAGKSPAAPYDKTRIDLNALAPALANTVAYSEPGALAHDGQLYLSLTTLQPRLSLTGIHVSHSIVLIASGDHGRSWKFVGTLLTPDDAQLLGCDFFDGSALAEDAGRFFLLVAPMVAGKVETHYGTAALEFDALAEGRLKRDAKRAPILAAYFAPQPSIFSGPGAGQSTYDSHNTRGGLLMPQFNLSAYPEVFQLFQTGRRIVTAPAK